MDVWTKLATSGHGDAVRLVEAFGPTGACLVQLTPDEWVVYVHEEPEVVRRKSPTLGERIREAVTTDEVTRALDAAGN